MKRILFALCALIVLNGCMKRMDAGYAMPQETLMAPAAVYESDAAPPAPPSIATAGAAMAKSAPRARAEGAPADKGATEAVSTNAAPVRMVAYTGWTRLRVTNIRETLDQVVALALASGGYLERMSDRSVTVRVPVALFKDIFGKVLKMGDVMDRSVTAEDVTDAFLALDLRLSTAKATRERLIELLAKAQSEQEKLQLLREIQRLTEQIDGLEVQTKTLSTLAQFSRITVEVMPRQAGDGQGSIQDVASFHWIRRLSPFRQDLIHSGKQLAFAPPEGLVQLNVKKRFITESADGAIFRATRIRNRPKGSTEFWLSAIRQRLEPEFASVEVLSAGSFQLLRFTERNDNPYQFLVGVQAKGRRLLVVEIYFPSSVQAQRYEKAILAMITEGPR